MRLRRAARADGSSLAQVDRAPGRPPRGVLAARRAGACRREPAAFFNLAPDWIAEVLSPATARLDRVRKMPLYAASGVRHAWLIDPGARTLEVYRLESGHWLLLGAHGDDALVRAEPFEAIEIELLRFWGESREASARA